MPRYSIQGPDVAAVGWIPYYDKWPDIPQPHLYRRSIAMRLLFNSGNPEPRANFPNADSFENWIGNTKEYRGALWLRDAALKWTDARPRPVFECTRDGLAGYTPPRVVVKGANLAPWPVSGHYEGRGSLDDPLPTPDPDSNGGEVTLTVKFKLSARMEKIGYLMTGYWAPSAWMKLTYRMEKTGRVTVKLQGSTIPSQAYYSGWQRRGAHDMLINSEQQISGFIEQAESCRMAPERDTFFKEVVQIVPVVES